jgi:hypothetical protein
MTGGLVGSSSQTDTIRELYIRMDAGRDDMYDLFTDDVQFYLPKFGTGRGTAQLRSCASGARTALRSLRHEADSFRFIESPHGVVLEGFTAGETVAGLRFKGGTTPGGRFCGVYEFRGPLISRIYIYFDPDYGGADEARFIWGREGRQW